MMMMMMMMMMMKKKKQKKQKKKKKKMMMMMMTTTTRRTTTTMMSQNINVSDAAWLLQKKRISSSYWPITKIKINEGKAVKPGQLFGTRQHNHATVCLVSKSVKKNMTFRL